MSGSSAPRGGGPLTVGWIGRFYEFLFSCVPRCALRAKFSWM